MNNDDLRRINSVLKTKHLSQLQKCQEFIAYLFEFCVRAHRTANTGPPSARRSVHELMVPYDNKTY